MIEINFEKMAEKLEGKLDDNKLKSKVYQSGKYAVEKQKEDYNKKWDMKRIQNFFMTGVFYSFVVTIIGGLINNKWVLSLGVIMYSIYYFITKRLTKKYEVNS